MHSNENMPSLQIKIWKMKEKCKSTYQLAEKRMEHAETTCKMATLGLLLLGSAKFKGPGHRKACGEKSSYKRATIYWGELDGAR